MTEIVIPPVELPFPPTLNPLVDALEAQVAVWTEAYDPTGTHGAQSKFGRLAARMYPNAALPELTVCALAFLWTFLLDDQLDPAGSSGGGPEAEQLIEQCLAALDAGGTSSPEPVVRCLGDLHRQVTVLAGDAWLRRYERDVREFLLAMLHEVGSRDTAPPDLDTYVTARRVTCTWPLTVDFMELAGHLEPSGELRRSGAYTAMYQAAADVLLSVNDLLSLRKELAAGEIHNLVIVLAHNRDSSIDAAVVDARHWISGRLDAYTAARDRFVERWSIPSPSGLGPDGALRYTAGLEAIMRGALDWQAETARYTTPGDGND